MKSLPLLLPVCLILGLACGCSDQRAPQYGSTPRDQRVAEAPAGAAQIEPANDVLAMAEPKAAEQGAGEGMPGGMPGMQPAGRPAQAPANAKPPAPPVARKIVYTADLRLVANDLEQAEQRVTEIVQESGGYIAQSDSYGTTGQPRHGQWRIRVPVARFQDCLAALLKLGVPEKNGTDSKDVSEEYYDLEARVKNLKVEEARLQGYLEDKKATSKLEDILAIERELTRVRGEIERAEGRRRLLANLSEMATINLTVREEKGYVPPQAPTFTGRVAGTFLDSVAALRAFGEGVVLMAAALAPWLPLLALAGVGLFLVIRRLRPASAQPATALPADGPGTPGS